MMLLKLEPNVETELPLAAYYGMTFVSLNVGDSGIASCTVRVGLENFTFKSAAHGEKGVLYVNGDPEYTPTHRMFKEHEKIMLVLPTTAESKVAGALVLNHYLSYSVPVRHNDK